MAYARTRPKTIFNPDTVEPFKVSRSRLEDFVRCPRCFYLDRRLGIEKPSMPGFTLNTAVDVLLKKEFDFHRYNKQAHPLMEEYGIDAVPYLHDSLDIWRENYKGITFHHEPTNFLVSGAVDDVWQTPDGQLHIVDYKSTSTSAEITLDGQYKEGYKRQMEIYQWLFRRNGFPVSDTGYFVYANGIKDRDGFHGKLEFTIQIIPYQGNDAWVEPKLLEAKECLLRDVPPDCAPDCEYCLYRQAAVTAEQSR